MTKTRTCPGCKLLLPLQQDLPLTDTGFNRYGVVSPECYELFLTVVSHEYEFGRPMAEAGIGFDAYAVQHPPHLDYQMKLGINERLIAASRQSVAVHLLALYEMLVIKKAPYKESTLTRSLESGHRFEDEELIAPDSLGDIRINDVVMATNKEEHMKLVLDWSWSAWNAWSKYHDKVRGWYEKYR